jgi:ribosome-interacting GTPase 1
VLAQVRAEVAGAGIQRPANLAATKLDEAPAGALSRLQAAVPELPVLGVSILDDESLAAFKEAIWKLTGLIGVYLRLQATVQSEPLALRPGATVADVAREIHGDIGQICRGARIWGPSARFDGQQVGREHQVEDGDIVQVLA